MHSQTNPSLNDDQLLEKVHEARTLPTPKAPVHGSRKRPTAPKKATRPSKSYRPAPTLFAGQTTEYTCQETDHKFILRKINLDIIELIDTDKNTDKTISLIRFNSSQKLLYGISNQFTPDVFTPLKDILSDYDVSENNPCTIDISEETPTEVIEKIPSYVNSIRLLTTDYNKASLPFPTHIRQLTINQYFPSSLLSKIPRTISHLFIEEKLEPFTHISRLPKLSSLYGLPNEIKVLTIPFIARNLDIIKSIPAHIETLRITNGTFFPCTIHKGGCNCTESLIHAIPPYIQIEKIYFEGCSPTFKDEVKRILKNRDNQTNVQEAPAPILAPALAPMLPNNDVQTLNATVAALQQTLFFNQQTIVSLLKAVNSLTTKQAQQENEINTLKNKLNELQAMFLMTPLQFNVPMQSEIEHHAEVTEDYYSSQEEEEEENGKGKEATELSPLRANSAIRQRQSRHSQNETTKETLYAKKI